MKKGHDFSQIPSVEKVRFRHSARMSVRIWKSFDEGRALFPADAAAELAKKAKCLMQFTRSQINCAWTKLEVWNGVASEVAYRQVIEKSAGLSSVDGPVLTWDGLGVERDEGKLRDQLHHVLGRIRCRMAAYL